MKRIFFFTLTTLCLFLFSTLATATKKDYVSDLVTVRFVFKDVNDVVLERAKFIPPFQIEENEVAGKILKSSIPYGAEKVDIQIDNSTTEINLKDLKRDNVFYIISIRGNISGLVYIKEIENSLIIQPW